MNKITYVADLPFELPLEEYSKIMNAIRDVVGDNLLRIQGSGVTFTQMGNAEDCYRSIRDSLKEFYTPAELENL